MTDKNPNHCTHGYYNCSACDNIQAKHKLPNSLAHAVGVKVTPSVEELQSQIDELRNELRSSNPQTPGMLQMVPKLQKAVEKLQAQVKQMEAPLRVNPNCSPAERSFLDTVRQYGLGPGVGECQDAWDKVVDEKDLADESVAFNLALLDEDEVNDRWSELTSNGKYDIRVQAAIQLLDNLQSTVRVKFAGPAASFAFIQIRRIIAHETKKMVIAGIERAGHCEPIPQ